jgi:FtsP/CotA-like multicopper oxidase with cupredoxin domain
MRRDTHPIAFAALIAIPLIATPALAFDPPVAVDINPDPDIVEVNLTAQETTWQFVTGIDTTVYAYNGSIPGPTIEAEVGNTVIVNFTNNLPEATTIHWHGVDTPATMDGSHRSQAHIQPGATFRYEFPVLNASLFWYHPHVRTFDQVEKGLYGALLVRDPAKDAELGFTGLEEHIVIFDDVLLDGALEIVPAFAFGGGVDPLRHAEYIVNGREGNHLLLNGKVTDEARITLTNGQPQRWRFLNAANTTFARIDPIEFGEPDPNGNLEWFRVGSDGGLDEVTTRLRFVKETWPPGSPPPPAPDLGFPEPLHPTASLLLYILQGVFLTPGERMDVIFTPIGEDGEVFTLWQRDWLRGRHTAAFDPNNPGQIVLEDDPLDGYYPSVPYLEVTLSGPDPGTGPFIPPMDLGVDNSVPGIPVGTLPVTMGHGDPDPQGNIILFNQADFSTGMMVPLPEAKIDSFNALDVNIGETWEWEVTNLTHGDHPFHTHGVTFVPEEFEWIDTVDPEHDITVVWPFRWRKDTIRIPGRGGAKGTTRAIMRGKAYFHDNGRENDYAAQGMLPTFDPAGDWISGGWLFHCHVLEHAARGMLSVYEVHDPDDPFTLWGKQLAGTGGKYPSLTIEGDPGIPGSTLTYRVVNGLPNATALLILGIEAERAKFKGGEIVPRAQRTMKAQTDPDGEVAFDLTAWSDIRSGRTLWGQVLVIDPGAPQGVAFSNAISFVIP